MLELNSFFLYLALDQFYIFFCSSIQMSKRIESALLIDTLLEEETETKKRRMQNTRDSYARNVNRLAIREQTLERSVQNLEWKRKKLKVENRALKVERARERKEIARPAISVVRRQEPCEDLLGNPPSTMSTAFFSPPASTSPPTPSIIASPSPFRSSYEPFLSDQNFQRAATQFKPPAPSVGSARLEQYMQLPIPEVYQPPPYVPPFVTPTPPHMIPFYTPGPIRSIPPITSFKERPEEYWRRLEILVLQKCNFGKKRIQNPEDGRFFQIQRSTQNRVRVRLNTKWELITDAYRR